VSSKKDKLIEEAQRLALRGQLDKAIKAYEQVITLDPTAINQRQKRAELLVKAGRIDDARSEFGAIGKFYSSNGYYLKAIAVYKKLQVMFPKDIAITLVLADLNEKHGLAANALVEYKQVYDYYEQNSNSVESLKILEKMHAVDQKNIGIKLKLAEAYFQADQKDESYALFGRLASLLQERHDSVGLNKLSARIQQLFPEKTEFMIEVLTEQVRGDAASTLNAVNSIQALLRNNSGDKRLWDLVVEAYQRLNQPQRVKIAYQHYLKFFPEELSVQKGLIECLIAERDVTGAIQLLDQYEQNFYDSSSVKNLLDIYTSLDLVEPINLRVLHGLKRSFEAIGDVENAATIDRKIESLQSFSEKNAFDERLGGSVTGSDSDQQSESTLEIEFAHVESGVAKKKDDLPRHNVESPAEPAAFDFSEPEEIEIEIEVDDGASPFATLAQDDAVSGAEEGAWLDAVDDVFDSIATSPRSVRFGSDVDITDAQTHYDLGVAFKEMGLYDEAINELRQAADDPERRVACLILQGTCLREKGSLETAENMLRTLLRPGLATEDTCSIKYELALTCEAAGKGEEAAGLLAEIDVTHPGFRDVRSRLAASGEESSLEFSEEELKGFDLK
jgi:tetratricopeptide (TPR) repeat protein